MLKIRLMRIGAKGRPFYRIVVVDERKKRTGSYIDQIGTYNPLTNPKEIKIDQTKVEEWTKKGAQLSDGFLRIIGKAPQKPARRPKKDRGDSASAGTESVSAPAPEAAEEQAPVADESTPAVAEENAAEEQTSVEENTVAAEDATEKEAAGESEEKTEE